MICYVDGGYRNDGTSNGSGYGSYKIIFPDGEKYEYSFLLPDAKSNNEAEYMSLINLLLYLNKFVFDEDIKIYSDSKLLVNQVNEIWQINKPELRELKNFVDKFKYIQYYLIWIPRKIIVKELGH